MINSYYHQDKVDLVKLQRLYLRKLLKARSKVKHSIASSRHCLLAFYTNNIEQTIDVQKSKIHFEMNLVYDRVAFLLRISLDQEPDFSKILVVP
jgi:hypothetical protein